MSEEPKKRGRGRPKNSEIATRKRNIQRFNKSDREVMNDYIASMLNSPKSDKVLKRIFEAALDDDHKNQAVAWKLIIDRIAPLAMVDEAIGKDSARTAIQINITGVNTIDGEIVESRD